MRVDATFRLRIALEPAPLRLERPSFVLFFKTRNSNEEANENKSSALIRLSHKSEKVTSNNRKTINKEKNSSTSSQSDCNLKLRSRSQAFRIQAMTQKTTSIAAFLAFLLALVGVALTQDGKNQALQLLLTLGAVLAEPVFLACGCLLKLSFRLTNSTIALETQLAAVNFNRAQPLARTINANYPPHRLVHFEKRARALPAVPLFALPPPQPAHTIEYNLGANSPVMYTPTQDQSLWRSPYLSVFVDRSYEQLPEGK